MFNLLHSGMHFRTSLKSPSWESGRGDDWLTYNIKMLENCSKSLLPPEEVMNL
jgi:hypothetical protein